MYRTADENKLLLYHYYTFAPPSSKCNLAQQLYDVAASTLIVWTHNDWCMCDSDDKMWTPTPLKRGLYEFNHHINKENST